MKTRSIRVSRGDSAQARACGVTRWTQPGLWRDECGATGVIMAMLLMALAGIAALAVDLAAMHMRRSSLQTSADAAAMAGANALISYGSDLTRVRTVILDYARKNLDSLDQPTVAVSEADIVFYKDGVVNTSSPNQVEVTVRRTQARGNAMSLFFGQAVDVDQADLSAKARAGVINAASSKCLKPWGVATKFTWNDYVESKKSRYYGNGMLDADSAAEMATLQVQGYAAADVGTQIVLKYGDPHDAMVPSQYNAVDYPPLNKGNPVPGA